MPVYLAKSIASGASRSQAYAAKSIPNYTMANLSDVPQMTKATSTELAFSGYKEAIEAFLYATALNSKVSTQSGFYPLPDFNPSIPLPLPPIVFRPRSILNPAQLSAILAAFNTSGIKTLPLGAGPQGFVVERPTWSDLNKISRLSGSDTTQPGSTIQQSAITPIRTLYKCIELFLKVNTYYYRRDDALASLAYDPNERQDTIDTITRINLPVANWFEGDKKRKAEPLEKDVFGRIRNGELELDEALRNRVRYVYGQDAVLVAKPSPKPFTASLGKISEVPNNPGLLFPYFHGAIACDTRGFRDLVARLFFRNFGNAGESDARRGYQEFRDAAGIIGSSSMGPILAHILKGFELALNAQAHAFLLFDNSDYLGFALLGDHFWCHDGMKWVDPLSAADLREELKNIQTHETTLGGIAVLLSEMRDVGGDLIHVEADEIQTPRSLLVHLSEVDEDQGDKVKELGTLLQGLKFKGGFKEISPQNVAWGLDMLTINRDAPLDDVNLYIPLSKWQDCASREFQVFAAFGPRAFHFQNKRGQRFAVPRKLQDVDPLSVTEGNPPVPVYPKILLYPCTIDEAVKKWRTFLGDGIVVMDFAERAKGSRAIAWEGANRKVVWDKLKEIGTGDFIHEKAVEGASTSNKKRPRPSDFDLGEFEEILGLEL